MRQDERRDRLMAAAESPQGFENLRTLAQQLLSQGVSKDTLLEDLTQIRALVAEPAEDHLLDVMDLLVGWCAPSAQLNAE